MDLMWVMMGLFFILLFLNVPVATVMGITSVVYLILDGKDLLIVAQRMFAGVDSFTLMAIPLYIFAAEIMNRCGITKRIFNLASEMVGFLPGGLAQVNVLASTLFAGISGSTSADVASLGVMEIAGMNEAGYSRPYSTAVTAASATIGSIIPPSILMVLYSSLTGVSCGKLFVAGVIPGLLVCVTQLLYCRFKAMKDPTNCDGNYRPKFNLKRLGKAFLDAVPALLMPLIIVGGTLSGVFTATEAGAVAGLYGILVGIFYFKAIDLKGLLESIKSTAHIVGQGSFIFAATSAFSYCLAIEQVPNKLGKIITGLTSNPYLLMLLIIIVMLVVGCFMDTSAAAIIMVPILEPIAAGIGFNPIHFAMVMVLTFIIGGITPPVGATLFIATSVGNVKFEDLVKDIWPLVALFALVMFAVAYYPPLATFLPSLVK